MDDSLSIGEFVILALAVYRGAILIAVDDGPGDIFWRLRDYVRDHTNTMHATEGDDGYLYRGTGRGKLGMVPSTLSRGIECPLCVSMWLGLVVVLLWWLAPVVTWWLCLPFALSGVTVVIERIGKHD